MLLKEQAKSYEKSTRNKAVYRKTIGWKKRHAYGKRPNGSMVVWVFITILHIGVGEIYKFCILHS